MDIFIIALAVAAGLLTLKSREQSQRIALLGSHLGHFQIEKLMERVIDGYMRALGEANDERRNSIWHMLNATEADLSAQFKRFVEEFARVDEPDARVSKLALGLPFVTRLAPALTFDMRKALAIHAHGLARLTEAGDALPPKTKAFAFMAELMLMQHTCHWFCKSKTVASARLLARHRTSHADTLNAVSPETRRAYLALISG